jgi:GDP-L-fucose synthase
MIEKTNKIFVAGHNGVVGSAIVRELKRRGFENIVTRDRNKLDLTNQAAVNDFFESERPELVFLAAAKVGGIVANDNFPAEFIYENLAIQNNVIHCSYKYDVKKLLFIASSCIYPKMAEQPIKEEYVVTGILERTNESYAIAKIAGLKMCEAYNKQYNTNYNTVLPCNLYGPNDNYNLLTSHVVPALIRKFSEAIVNNRSSVIIWGTGKVRREFMHVDDLASACVFLMENYNGRDPINIGFGEDIEIYELAKLLSEITGFKGSLIFDQTKPDGPSRKLLDSTKLFSMGWRPGIALKEGLESIYHDYQQNNKSYRR